MTQPVMHLPPLLNAAHTALDTARKALLDREPARRSAQGEKDDATGAALHVERTIRDFLARATPGIGVLGGEEGGHDLPDGPAWVLDPVDGAVNYSRGLPLYGTSLALLIDGTPEIGVIDLPRLEERYSAVGGLGAYRNEERLAVGTISGLAAAVVNVGDDATVDGAAGRNEAWLAVTSRLAGAALRVRMVGAASVDLAWLAGGLTDAVVVFSAHPWKTAAGVLIAREAGAVVVDAHGSPHSATARAMLAANPALIEEVAALVAEATGAGRLM